MSNFAQQLIDCLLDGPKSRQRAQQLILRLSLNNDAQQKTLLKAGYWQDPLALYAVLRLIESEIDPAFAERLYDYFFVQNAAYIKDQHSEAYCCVIEVLAKKKHAAMKTFLCNLIFEEVDTDADYAIYQTSVLALLHFDLLSHQQSIESKLQLCLGKHLFDEYIPVLVCKLPLQKQAAWLDKLWELGELCSTDSNGGIIYAFGLTGELGRSYLQRLLFSPSWEAVDWGTGSVWATYQALKAQGISLLEVWQSALKEEDLAFSIYQVLKLIKFYLNTDDSFAISKQLPLFEMLETNQTLIENLGELELYNEIMLEFDELLHLERVLN
ncbi:hypothetical protein VQ643_03515 [Pseudomonas sp. F1_0610]|uniref:hypothetical protein n=1 Tax=Pseudomonas sp. F1_0610 TaxID=3114284 RepID=UPI0039C1608C